MVSGGAAAEGKDTGPMPGWAWGCTSEFKPARKVASVGHQAVPDALVPCLPGNANCPAAAPDAASGRDLQTHTCDFPACHCPKAKKHAKSKYCYYLF